MFKLIALVSLVDGAPVEALLERAREALSRERSMVSFGLHRDAGQTEHFSVAHATFALVCEFASVEDWKRYVAGPVHEELGALFGPWGSGATVIQFHD